MWHNDLLVRNARKAPRWCAQKEPALKITQLLDIRAHYDIASGDEGTLEETIPWMRRLILEGAQDDLVQRRTREVVAASPDLHPVVSLFRFIRAMPYTEDEKLSARWGFSEDTTEILQGASGQLALEELGLPVEGDCDCRTILLGSLLEALGYPVSLVTVRGSERPDFSHVYLEVEVEGGQIVPLDTIMDGRGGRPLLEAGEEVGAPMFHDRTTFPVREENRVKSLGPLALVAIAIWRIFS